MEDILNVLRNLICENFEDNQIMVTSDTALNEIEQWDSMEHINIISMIEQYYGFHFNVGEMTAMCNVKTIGDILDIIAKKLV